ASDSTRRTTAARTSTRPSPSSGRTAPWSRSSTTTSVLPTTPRTPTTTRPRRAATAADTVTTGILPRVREYAGRSGPPPLSPWESHARADRGLSTPRGVLDDHQAGRVVRGDLADHRHDRRHHAAVAGEAPSVAGDVLRDDVAQHPTDL